MKYLTKFLFVFMFLLIPLWSLNNNCLDISLKPLKEKINISDFSEFLLVIKNNCDKDLNLKFKYEGYVYNIIFTPLNLELKKDETGFVNIKVYPPNYLYSGWKALKINIYSVENREEKLIDQQILKFYIFPTPKEIEKKIEYKYIVLTKNIDVVLDIPPKILSDLNKKVPFQIILKGLNKTTLEDFSLTIFITPLDNYTQKFKNLEVEWSYLDNLNNSYVVLEDDKIIFNNYLLVNFDVAPIFYKITALLNIREKNKFDISEKAENNVLIEGVPYFITKKECFSNFYKKQCVYLVENIGNKKGVYELVINLNPISKLFVSYSFPAKIEDNKIIKKVELMEKDKKRFVVEYNYLSLYIIVLVVLIVVGIYYYLVYYNPLSVKKEIQKIEISKNKRSFYLEIIVKNNSFKTLKGLLVVEKIKDSELSKLSIYPRPDKIKEDLNSKTIVWEIKEIKPFSSKIFRYKISPKDKSALIILPTIVKFKDKIFEGNGLKINLKESIKVEEI